jgi:hypothetical protein
MQNKRAKSSKRSHVICSGNRKVVRSTREAVGTMRYRAE